MSETARQATTSSAEPVQRPLDEVMLAMDVVDTLRHRQILVERELQSEERDQKLIERLREIYAAQGLEVTDAILAEGVQALQEERFTYVPPQPGLSVHLARLYVNRGTWFKRISILLATVFTIWALYYFLVSAPATREVRRQTTEINTSLSSLDDQLTALERKAAHIAAALPQAGLELDPKLRNAATTRKEQATGALDKAGELTAAARAVAQQPNIDAADLGKDGRLIRERLAKQQSLVSQATQSTDQAETALLAIASLQGLPRELAAQRDAIEAGAKVDDAIEQAREAFSRGMNALRGGDIDAANNAAVALTELRKRLDTAFEIRVVSRPDEYSAFWRIPERNPDTRNYYVVVEAVAADGSRLRLPIRNEEDGLTRRVDRWALRIDRKIFDRIADDKQDDGILQNSRFGEKKSGYLEPEYLYPVHRGAITQW